MREERRQIKETSKKMNVRVTKGRRRRKEEENVKRDKRQKRKRECV
jgi:hypothetical protein